MKLSEKTIAVLENFQAINPAIVIDEGNIISTISVSGSIFASAKVEEKFPVKFGIYELAKFLGVIGLDKSSDIELLDDYMIISQGDTKIKYVYCEPSLIARPPPGDINMKKDVVFSITSEVLSKIFKAMGVLKYSSVAITGKDGVLAISAISNKDPENSIRYSVNLGETDKTFSYVIGSEILKVEKTNYTVTIDGDGISHFHSPEIEYWIGLKND